jgi:hypothetical protein
MSTSAGDVAVRVWQTAVERMIAQDPTRFMELLYGASVPVSWHIETVAGIHDSVLAYDRPVHPDLCVSEGL